MWSHDDQQLALNFGLIRLGRDEMCNIWVILSSLLTTPSLKRIEGGGQVRLYKLFEWVWFNV